MQFTDNKGKTHLLQINGASARLILAKFNLNLLDFQATMEAMTPSPGQAGEIALNA